MKTKKAEKVKKTPVPKASKPLKPYTPAVPRRPNTLPIWFHFGLPAVPFTRPAFVAVKSLAPVHGCSPQKLPDKDEIVGAGEEPSLWEESEPVSKDWLERVRVR